ncbi:13510_t:CDS:2 [Acaulospora colombiana]|uniref:13510_t:CDS:1 n=1 Tax=Acaulospora colombiana TaxID=27376 RepID=A0ACA9MBG4_9GLOM|nr:13510_t:CDS:2 [Acaulospora colombiana]
MPNAISSSDTNNSNNVPSSKNRKNKKKSLALTTSEDASPRQEPPSPTTPAPDSVEGNLENANKGPYMEFVGKRIRTLKKKLGKIEKSKELINTNPDWRNILNEDQIQSCERESEVSGALRELEEITKQFEKENQKVLKEQQDEREQAISNAVEKVKATHLQSVISLLKFFRLVHLHKSGVTRFTEDESESIEILQTLFFNAIEDSKGDQYSERRILETLDKLCQGDESVIGESGGNGITYSHIHSLIQSPPISVEEEAVHENSNETVEETITQEEITNNQDDNNGDMFEVPPGGLQFRFHRAANQNFIYQYTNENDGPVDQIAIESDIQESYQQQQTFTETFTVTQEYTTEQQQTDKNQFPVDKQQEQSKQVTDDDQQPDDQPDSQQQPKPISQQNDQPPPLSRTSSHKGRGGGGYRGRGYRGQGQNPRRDSRDGNYRNGGYGGNFRGNRGGGSGNANSGPRGGRGNGYQGERKFHVSQK